MKKVTINEDVKIPGTNYVLEKGDKIEIYSEKELEESKLNEVVLTYWNKYSDIALEEVLNSPLMIVDKVSIIMKKIKSVMFASERMDDREQFKFYKIMNLMVRKILSKSDEVAI